MIVSLPPTAPDEVASVVAVTLDGPPVVTPYIIGPDPKGVFWLGAESSEIQSRLGERAKKENLLGHVYLTDWSRNADVAVWPIHVPAAGRYHVELSYGAGRSSGTTPSA